MVRIDEIFEQGLELQQMCLPFNNHQQSAAWISGAIVGIGTYFLVLQICLRQLLTGQGSVQLKLREKQINPLI
jgi:hypothetical protein